MRVKTEARRQAIMGVAKDAFQERGFDATSMSDVAARLGGSKATLYNYFGSKEELFAAVMMDAAKEQATRIFAALEAEEDIEPALFQFARDYLRFMLQPEILAINRMCVAEGERLGPALFERGPKIGWTKVAKRLQRAMDASALRSVDSWVAALQLKGLCEANLLDQRLRGCRHDCTEAEIAETADAAVDTFLRAYRS